MPACLLGQVPHYHSTEPNKERAAPDYVTVEMVRSVDMPTVMHKLTHPQQQPAKLAWVRPELHEICVDGETRANPDGESFDGETGIDPS